MSLLRNLIYYILLYIRPLFLLGSKLMGFLFLLMALAFYITGMGTLATASCLGFSFGIFILRHFYDGIILKLNPTGNTLILEQ